MRETKNEELAQQQKREGRGKGSEAPVTQESRAEDNNFVKEILRIIDGETIPASTARIGMRSETKPKPIQINLKELA